MSKSCFNFSFKTFLLLLKDIVKIITYPIRKPLVGIPVVLIMFILPTFNGVRPGEVPNWYWQKLNPVKKVVTNFSDAVEKHSKPITNEFGKIIQTTSDVLGTNKGLNTDKEPNIISLGEPNDKTDEVVDVEFGETRRKAFGEGKIVSDYEFPNETYDDYIEEEFNDEYVDIEEDREEIEDTFGLTYLDERKTVIGVPKVINANQLSIDGNTIILHGIYTDPDSRLGRRAALYLAKVINESEIVCEIKAYTEDAIATGICYADDVNLNEMLVNDGFSEQVFKS